MLLATAQGLRELTHKDWTWQRGSVCGLCCPQLRPARQCLSCLHPCNRVFTMQPCLHPCNRVFKVQGGNTAYQLPSSSPSLSLATSPGKPDACNDAGTPSGLHLTVGRVPICGAPHHIVHAHPLSSATQEVKAKADPDYFPHWKEARPFCLTSLHVSLNSPVI